jgi:hypothetical protein
MDIGRLVSDLKTLAALLTALKKVLRTSGHQTSSMEARALRDLKARATRLCALRAQLRGRLHLKGMSLEEQAAFVDEERQLYQIGEAA